MSSRKKTSHTWRILIWLQVPILLVGNKVDLEHQREVPTVEGMVSVWTHEINLIKVTTHAVEFFAGFGPDMGLFVRWGQCQASHER